MLTLKNPLGQMWAKHYFFSSLFYIFLIRAVQDLATFPKFACVCVEAHSVRREYYCIY